MRARRVAVAVRWAVAGVLLAVAIPGVTQTARADRGVALDVGRVSAAGVLGGGDVHALTPVVVYNPGSEAARYEMGVEPDPDGLGLAPDSRWLRFEPASFALEPGETRRVTIRLDLPSGASSGSYRGLITATLVSDEGATRLGGAAAARLSFEVESSGPLRQIGDFVAGHLAFAVLPAVLLLVAAFYRFVAGRFTLRWERRM